MGKRYMGEFELMFLILILNPFLMGQEIKALTDYDTNKLVYELHYFDQGECPSIITSFQQVQMFYGDISNKLYILGEVKTTDTEYYTLVKSDVTKLYDLKFLFNGWTIDDANNLLYLVPLLEEFYDQFTIITINLSSNKIVESIRYPDVNVNNFQRFELLLSEDGDLFFREPFLNENDFKLWKVEISKEKKPWSCLSKLAYNSYLSYILVNTEVFLVYVETGSTESNYLKLSMNSTQTTQQTFDFRTNTKEFSLSLNYEGIKDNVYSLELIELDVSSSYYLFIFKSQEFEKGPQQIFKLRDRGLSMVEARVAVLPTLRNSIAIIEFKNQIFILFDLDSKVLTAYKTSSYYFIDISNDRLFVFDKLMLKDNIILIFDVPSDGISLIYDYNIDKDLTDIEEFKYLSSTINELQINILESIESESSSNAIKEWIYNLIQEKRTDYMKPIMYYPSPIIRSFLNNESTFVNTQLTYLTNSIEEKNNSLAFDINWYLNK